MKIFSWSVVPSPVIRQMLIAVYEGAGQAEETPAIRKAADKRLPEMATAVLGRPPAAGHTSALMVVLRGIWLEELSRNDLHRLVADVQLSLSGPAKQATFTSKKSMVDFLRQRNETETLRLILRKAFVAHYKVDNGKASERRPGSGDDGQVRAMPVELKGRGRSLPHLYAPYPHQEQAWASLDELATKPRGERRGLLVLPTGAGKTFTMVAWLLRQMVKDPKLRVLWIADQQELVDQAARAFEADAPRQGEGFAARLRVIHARACMPSTLVDPDLRIACITRQSLMGKAFPPNSRKRLETFVRTRPTIVVIDEAHHSVSESYQTLISAVTRAQPRAMLLGLTATPWPSGPGMSARLRETFPTEILTVETRDLVKSGILARPTFHTVDTAKSVSLDPQEARRAARQDLSAQALKQFDDRARNELVVKTWKANSQLWGKTLVFACNIAHAEALGALFREEGAKTTVLHSKVGSGTKKVLADFNNSTGEGVLVSVGMLTEGVDIPSARTAILARPTTSRILMRQMIGRVLRGTFSGGDAIAHIVDMRDRWTTDVDVLSPVDIPGIPGNTARGESHAGSALPPIQLEDGDGESLNEELPSDVEQRIRKAYNDHTQNLPYSEALISTQLVGFYELGDVNVPVFEHAQGRWDALIARVLKGKKVARGAAIDEFDDLPVPRPVATDVRDVIEFVRSHQVEPPLVAARANASARAVAADVLDQEELTFAELLEFVKTRYESSLNRVAVEDFQEFYLNVQRQMLALQSNSTGFTPEALESADPDAADRPKLRASTRDIGSLFAETVEAGRKILESEAPELYPLLAPENLPVIKWTRAPVKSTFAYWSPRISGQRRGEPIIQVNRALEAPKKDVPDRLLHFLIWHELCHHLLPWQGHDSEFRRLEAAWPQAQTRDFELDALLERFDL